LYVFGWPAWMTSGFSGNLAPFNVEYCHVHCDCVEPNKFSSSSSSSLPRYALCASRGFLVCSCAQIVQL